MLSSHILPDVEALCDRVAIVLHGRLERIATVGELVAGGAPRVEVRLAGHLMIEWPARFAGEMDVTRSGGDTVMTLHDASLVQELLGWLVSQRIEVRSITPVRSTLEELFMAAAEGAAFQAAIPVESRRRIA